MLTARRRSTSTRSGFGVEQDVQVDENHRFVELMPPGSPCSIALTTGYIDSPPGCLKGVQLNVENVDEVHAFLRDPDVEMSEIQDYPWGRFCFSPTPTATVGQSTARCIRVARQPNETLTSGTGVSIDDPLPGRAVRERVASWMVSSDVL
jgi:hypothetical protein